MRDSVGAYSAQTAFFITVSFIPFIMLLISMVGLFPVEESALIPQIIGSSGRPEVAFLLHIPFNIIRMRIRIQQLIQPLAKGEIHKQSFLQRFFCA